MKHIVICIDGPAGTGKSTIARTVAKNLGYLYLDTGALYRAAAVAIEDAGIDADDDAACASVVKKTLISLENDTVLVNGKDMTQRIRTNTISTLSSRIAAHPSVRKELLELQRSFRGRSSLVAEGRDTGSVVFPDAEIKLYLDATNEERARRRHNELTAKGVTISFNEVLQDITERDMRDSTRDTAPLVIPKHAVVVDTTHLDIEGVVHKIMDVVRGYLAD